MANIKPSDPNGVFGKPRFLPGGRVEMFAITVKTLIIFAYGVEEDRIQGGPKWADTDRFDIVAKAGPDSSVPTLRLMLANLLAERFKLSIHREDKIRSAYVLTVGKKGTNLQPGSGGNMDCNWSAPEPGLRRRECHNLTMAEFVQQLPGLGGAGIDLPVIDQTGLKGAYDLQFDLSDGSGGKGKGEGAGTPPVDPGPTIFTALEKIGLKLETRKMPVSIVVIDQVDHPSAN